MLRLLLAGILVASAFAGAASAQPAPEPLFVALDAATSSAASASAPSRSAAAIDRQIVGMRLDRLFLANSDRVLLDVGSHTLTARFERLDPDVLGHRSWVGTIEGVEYSHVSFTERAGVVSGVIDAGPDSYELRTIVPGVYSIERLDRSQFKGEAEPLVDAAQAAIADPMANVVPDDGSTIDVLILYTPNARTRLGGASQIQATVAQIVSDSNTAFTRSGVATRFRLAASAELTHTEASSMSSDLSTVTNSSVARGLRDQHRADLVQLLVDSPDTGLCGIAWLFSSLSNTNFNAYSVADVACVSQYTPTHEMGHNMGSHHAPEDNASGALFSYSYGYKDQSRGFRTLMAYACSGSPSCPRVLNWSNPGVSHNSGATGSSTQNNALSINNAANAVSNFRQATTAPPPPPPPPPTMTPPGVPTGLLATVNGTSVTLSWNPVTADEAEGGSSPSAATSYTVQVGNVSGVYALFLGTVSTTSVTGTAPAGTYYWRVTATNSAGAGPPSAQAQFTIGPATCVAPGAPQNFNFTLAGRTVSLIWTAPSSGTLPITYVVEAGSLPALANLYNAQTGSSATVVTAAAPPGTYYVRIRAQNACGISAPSNERTIVVP